MNQRESVIVVGNDCGDGNLGRWRSEPEESGEEENGGYGNRGEEESKKRTRKVESCEEGGGRDDGEEWVGRAGNEEKVTS